MVGERKKKTKPCEHAEKAIGRCVFFFFFFFFSRNGPLAPGHALPSRAVARSPPPPVADRLVGLVERGCDACTSDSKNRKKNQMQTCDKINCVRPERMTRRVDVKSGPDSAGSNREAWPGRNGAWRATLHGARLTDQTPHPHPRNRGE